MIKMSKIMILIKDEGWIIMEVVKLNLSRYESIILSNTKIGGVL